eukprot:augustus_masked-scaffold_1-processed-gene-10.4-mRNA-1 protein AED:1.00 eAED:1.00 QI:0/-1/0/0/-1/1/1/0/1216
MVSTRGIRYTYTPEEGAASSHKDLKNSSVLPGSSVSQQNVDQVNIQLPRHVQIQNEFNLGEPNLTKNNNTQGSLCPPVFPQNNSGAQNLPEYPKLRWFHPNGYVVEPLVGSIYSSVENENKTIINVEEKKQHQFIPKPVKGIKISLVVKNVENSTQKLSLLAKNLKRKKAVSDILQEDKELSAENRKKKRRKEKFKILYEKLSKQEDIFARGPVASHTTVKCSFCFSSDQIYMLGDAQLKHLHSSVYKLLNKKIVYSHGNWSYADAKNLGGVCQQCLYQISTCTVAGPRCIVSAPATMVELKKTKIFRIETNETLVCFNCDYEDNVSWQVQCLLDQLQGFVEADTHGALSSVETKQCALCTKVCPVYGFHHAMLKYMSNKVLFRLKQLVKQSAKERFTLRSLEENAKFCFDCLLSFGTCNLQLSDTCLSRKRRFTNIDMERKLVITAEDDLVCKPCQKLFGSRIVDSKESAKENEFPCYRCKEVGDCFLLNDPMFDSMNTKLKLFIKKKMRKVAGKTKVEDSDISVCIPCASFHGTCRKQTSIDCESVVKNRWTRWPPKGNDATFTAKNKFDQITCSKCEEEGENGGVKAVLEYLKACVEISESNICTICADIGSNYKFSSQFTLDLHWKARKKLKDMLLTKLGCAKYLQLSQYCKSCLLKLGGCSKRKNNDCISGEEVFASSKSRKKFKVIAGDLVCLQCAGLKAGKDELKVKQILKNLVVKVEKEVRRSSPDCEFCGSTGDILFKSQSFLSSLSCWLRVVTKPRLRKTVEQRFGNQLYQWYNICKLCVLKLIRCTSFESFNCFSRVHHATLSHREINQNFNLVNEKLICTSCLNGNKLREQEVSALLNEVTDAVQVDDHYSSLFDFYQMKRKKNILGRALVNLEQGLNKTWSERKKQLMSTGLDRLKHVYYREAKCWNCPKSYFAVQKINIMRLHFGFKDESVFEDYIRKEGFEIDLQESWTCRRCFLLAFQCSRRTLLACSFRRALKGSEHKLLLPTQSYLECMGCKRDSLKQITRIIDNLKDKVFIDYELNKCLFCSNLKSSERKIGDFVNALPKRLRKYLSKLASVSSRALSLRFICLSCLLSKLSCERRLSDSCIKRFKAEEFPSKEYLELLCLKKRKDLWCTFCLKQFTKMQREQVSSSPEKRKLPKKPVKRILRIKLKQPEIYSRGIIHEPVYRISQIRKRESTFEFKAPIEHSNEEKKLLGQFTLSL